MKRAFWITALFILLTMFFPFLPNQNVSTLLHASITPAKQGSSIFVPPWPGCVAETNLANPLSGVVTDATGSWVVPTAIGSFSGGSGYSCIWVGIDGYTNKSEKQTGTVEQIGTEQDWVNGSPTYYAWYEMYPKPSVTIPNAVLPGDIIVAEVQYIGNSQFLMKLNDVHRDATTWTFRIMEKSNKPFRNSAEWIVEAPWLGSVLALANIGTLNISNAAATISGVTGPIDSRNWQHISVTLNDLNGGTATPTKLNNYGHPLTSNFSVITSAQ